MFLAYMMLTTVASVLVQKYELCTVQSYMKTNGKIHLACILIPIQTCVQFLVSATSPKVHKVTCIKQRGKQTCQRNSICSPK